MSNCVSESAQQSRLKRSRSPGATVSARQSHSGGSLENCLPWRSAQRWVRHL